VTPARRNVLVTLAIVAALCVAAYLAFGSLIVTTLSPVLHGVVGIQAKRDVAAAFSGKHRLTVLVLGNQEDEGTSDTVILARLDLDRRSATLVSIPRDTWVTVPGHGDMKINSAIGAGGPTLTARVVSAQLGVPIDATMVVQPEGAKQLVDAMGGLNIDVEKNMDYDDNYGDLHIHLRKGEQYLTGGQVLEYMRFRHDDEGDFGRMRRQQQVVRAIAHQMARPDQWAKLPRLIALARKDVQTPLNDAQLQALVETYRSIAPDDVRTLTLPARIGSVGDASVVFVDERWAKLIGRIVFAESDPPQDPVLVANATGDEDFGKALTGALRGGGWNVATFIDEPVAATSTVRGSSPAAAQLRRLFLGAGSAASGSSPTVFKAGTDLLPQTN
jgi:polyisoprenyl-teichoic acid--peptidoglycan teichoic acid transferase